MEVGKLRYFKVIGDVKFIGNVSFTGQTLRYLYDGLIPGTVCLAQPAFDANGKPRSGTVTFDLSSVEEVEMQVGDKLWDTALQELTVYELTGDIVRASTARGFIVGYDMKDIGIEVFTGREDALSAAVLLLKDKIDALTEEIMSLSEAFKARILKEQLLCK